MKQAICQHCGIEFQYKTEPRNGERKYCGRECANRSKKTLPEHGTCPVCNTRFFFGGRQKKCCSPECSMIWRSVSQKKEYPIHTCIACGKEFEHKRPELSGNYCSRACSRISPNIQKRRLPRIPKTCLHCGKEFECAPYHETDCCSRECSNRHTAKTQVGRNHPLYKERIEKTCEVCGAIRLVKPAMVERFRACSKRCAAVLAQIAMPRVSSIEVAMIEEFKKIGLAPFSQFLVDFYPIDIAFPEKKVAVECDGTYWHSSPERKKKDRQRDEYLKRREWTVIRLPEKDIKADIGSCVAIVLSALQL